MCVQQDTAPQGHISFPVQQPKKAWITVPALKLFMSFSKPRAGINHRAYIYWKTVNNGANAVYKARFPKYTGMDPNVQLFRYLFVL